jgi:peptide/nickel transport system permease protein
MRSWTHGSSMTEAAQVQRSKQGYWRLVWRQFRKNWLSLFALILVLLLGLIAIAAPMIAHDRPIYMVKEGKTYWFANIIDYPELRTVPFKRWVPGEGEYALRPPIPHSPDAQDLWKRLEAPSRQHWLGTDDGGRDLLSRLIWGTRISMSVGFVAVGISVFIGIILGSLAGFYGGWVDVTTQRLIEIMMMFPTFILILSMRAFLPPSIYTTMVIIGITG